MGDDFDTGRTEAFSDGVFAIAATLLVLELSVPDDAFGDLWRGIGDQWPAYLAYLTSFWTIGGLWLGHHSMLRRMAFCDGWFLRINLLLLLVVVFLPYPTSLMSDALGQENKDAEQVSVLFYGATLLVISVIFTAMALYVAHHERLLREGAASMEMRSMAARSAPNLGFFGGIVALAVVFPDIAAFALLVVTIAPHPARPGREQVVSADSPLRLLA